MKIKYFLRNLINGEWVLKNTGGTIAKKNSIVSFITIKKMTAQHFANYVANCPKR